ncbi:hypothetical protein [Paenibacillus glycanilyticus]|uniref:hypothetical protein n=1 Tax=Paenibacillus glycanilyticus TaxID=126569 RepID=UPI002040B583|nr:hypothetical protein [Paenibacillus glycanilyticus]
MKFVILTSFLKEPKINPNSRKEPPVYGGALLLIAHLPVNGGRNIVFSYRRAAAAALGFYKWALCPCDIDLYTEYLSTESIAKTVARRIYHGILPSL